MWTDNPVADAERYYSRLKRKIRICPWCDEPIKTAHAYDIDGEIICKKCLDDNFAVEIVDYYDKAEDDPPRVVESEYR